MRITRLALMIVALMLTALLASAQEATPEATLDTVADATAEPTMDMMAESTPESTDTAMMDTDGVIAQYEGLFPEGIEYVPATDRFLVSSIGFGTVYIVRPDGSVQPFIEDERIPSSIGLEVDEAGNRLLVAATNLESEAYLGVYDLTTGANLAWIDFAPLLPTERTFFANDITVDAAGNIYVTDSLAGAIYRVDAAYTPSVFLRDESFSTDFALNGIEYHAPTNTLIAVRVPGLIRIPLDNPAAFTPVEADVEIPGLDGITFIDDSTLAAVSNVQGRVYRLESADDFTTASENGIFETGNVNPTTVAIRDGEPYVLYAQLNAQEETRVDFPIVYADFGE